MEITPHEEFCDHQAEVGRLEAENAELKRQLELCRGFMDNEKYESKQLDKSLEWYKNKLEEARSRIKDMEAYIERTQGVPPVLLNEQVQKLIERIKELEAKIEDWKERYMYKNNEVDKLQHQVRNLQDRDVSHSGDVEALELKLAAAQERIKELERDAEIQKSLSGLNNEMHQHALNELDDARCRIEELEGVESQLSGLEFILKESEVRIKELKEDLQAYKSESERMEAKLEIIRKTLEL